MKRLNELEQVDKEALKEEAIRTIKEIMSRHKEIDLTDIRFVGVIETGEFQFKVPRDIMYRQIITLIAYLMWFYDINEADIKNG